MRKEGIRLTAVLLALLPAAALPCSVTVPARTLRHDVEAADIIVLARALSSSAGTGWSENIEFEVARAYKGDPAVRIHVVATCDHICWFTCFQSGVPVILFLERHTEDRVAWAPKYRLIRTQFSPMEVRGDRVETPLPAWSEHREARTLALVQFEELVRKAALADREPPLTFRFTR